MLLFQELQLLALHLTSKPPGCREESQAMQGPRVAALFCPEDPPPPSQAFRTRQSGCHEEMAPGSRPEEGAGVASSG